MLSLLQRRKSVEDRACSTQPSPSSRSPPELTHSRLPPFLFVSQGRQIACPFFTKECTSSTGRPPMRSTSSRTARLRMRPSTCRISCRVVRLIPLRMLLQQTLCQQDAPTTLFSESYTWTRSRVQETTRRSSGQNTRWTVRRLRLIAHVLLSTEQFPPASNSYSPRQNAPGPTRKNFCLSLPSWPMHPRPVPGATTRLDASAVPSTGRRSSSRSARCYTTSAVSVPKTSSR